jgi:hypothetical protein
VYKEIRSNPDEAHKTEYAPFVIDDDGIGWVLFVGNDDETEIKIGYSGRKGLKNRFNEYKKSGFFGDSDMHLLAAVRGTQQNEQDVHSFFKGCHNTDRDARGQTEFFYAVPELLDYIAYLRSLYFVSISLEESTAAAGTSTVSYELWKPGNGHRKVERADVGLFAKEQPWSFFPDRSMEFLGDDWYTDDKILDCARTALDNQIDLDPASHVVANEKVKATKFYTEQEDGLSLPWYGRVWLNPPFSKWKLFSKKIVRELDRGEIQKMVILANSRTVTAMFFKPILRRSKAVCILHGRHSFWGRDIEGSPSNGQMLFFFSADDGAALFDAACDDIGATFHNLIEADK